jgi:hypothetical protein
MAYPATRSSSEDLLVNPLSLQVVNKMSLVFYYGAHYPTQTAIGVVVAGGTAPYNYFIRGSLPPGISIDSLTGIFTFDPTDPAAVPGRWEDVEVAIGDAAGGGVATRINITVDGNVGSSPPAGLTMPAPTSLNNSAGVSGAGPYSINGYTQSMLNLGTADLIDFNAGSTPIAGTWVITARVVTTTGGTSSITTPTIPTTPNNNTVSYVPSIGQVSLSSGDPLYPPGSIVSFTAVCTRTSDGLVGTTVVNLTMPLTEIVPTLVTPDGTVTEDLSQISSGIYTYNVGDNASIQNASPGSQYITVVGVPAAAGYSIVVVPLQGMGQSTWNSTLSQIDITTNANFGTGTQTIGKGYIFKYEDGTANKMPLGITSGNDELMVNVIDNYQ